MPSVGAPSAGVPERLRWIVGLLAGPPGRRLLEVGCGRGVAVDQACRQLAPRHVVGLDRSGTAIAAARARNAGWTAAGTASFVEASLDEITPDAGPFDAGTFDAVFAMNVNLFWTGSPATELGLLRALLAPGGVVHLGWEAPSAARAEDIVDRTSRALDAGGFAHEVTRAEHNPALVCLTARPR